MSRAATIEPLTVRIPAGDFLMGSDAGEDNEAPVHRVYVDKFELARFAVSNREYARFLEATDHAPPRFWGSPGLDAPDQPVVGPSWHSSVAYCEWLSEATGKRYRLPTEAEGEKAARGGLGGRKYPWGDDLPNDHAGGRDTFLEPVDAYDPNGYGLYGMASGVHEWRADWFDADYYATSPYRNPTGPERGTRKAARGGSWRHQVRFTRCAARSSLAPDKEFSDFGFRVALSIG